MEPVDPPQFPEALGRYRIVRRLGAGGMAEVFLAKSRGAEGIEKMLVLKRILPSFARNVRFIAMFVDEAKVAMRLNHPNIVQVYSFEQVRDEFLLAMEFVDGIDLARFVAEARRKRIAIDYATAAYITLEIARGLDYAHRRRDEHGNSLEIVHRDVSPQNVLLTHDGNVKLTDFGIARAKRISKDTGIIKGKFAYMSPEQAKGEMVDRRSDLYSLGVLFAELLMGRPMYPGKSGLEVLEDVRQGKLTLPRAVDPGVPEILDQLVQRATHYDRHQRLATARDFANSLADFLHRQSSIQDSQSLERFMAKVVPRPPEFRSDPPTEPDSPMGRELPQADALASNLRELRPVVVVAGRVLDRSKRRNVGASFVRRNVRDDAAQVLAEIAYKYDAVLSWSDPSERSHFRFLIGLGRVSVNDPLKALRLAMDMAEAIEGLQPEDEEASLAVVVGISRGTMIVHRNPEARLLSFDAIDDVLALADGIVAGGEAGEILVSGAVYRLVHRVFAFEEKGTLRLEDRQSLAQEEARVLAEVRVFRFSGSRAIKPWVEESAYLPSRLELVGRRDEMEWLRMRMVAALEGKRAQLSSVVGELGTGKTALIASLLKSRADRAPHFLHVECSYGASEEPYSALAELVRQLCTRMALERGGTEQELEVLRALLPQVPEKEAILKVLGVLLGATETVGREGVEGNRSTLWLAVRSIFRAFAQERPFVLWVDSAQWADSSSLELLGRLWADEAQAWFAIFAFRPDPRVAAIFPRSERLELGELDESQSRKLIASAFDGAVVSSEIERSILERAGGNPLFILELVEAMRAQGAVSIEEQGEVRWVVGVQGSIASLPRTLEGLIAARLSELSEEQRVALRWLAVAGPGFRSAELSHFAGKDLSDFFEQLETTGFVHLRPGRGYAFVRAVSRHIVYAMIDPADRMRMHRRVAEYIQQSESPLPSSRLANHLEFAGQRLQAGKAYMEAAREARWVYSNEEALRFYGRALSLLPENASERFQAYEGRAQIFRGLGRRREEAREIERMHQLAQKSGDPARLALVFNRLARFELDGARTIGVDSHLDQALQWAVRAGEIGAEVEALRLRVQWARERGDSAYALECCDRALRRTQSRPGLLAAQGSVRIQRSLLLQRLGRLEEALDDAAEAFVIFRRLGIKRNEAQALNLLGVVSAMRGHYEDAVALIRASIVLDREIGDRFHLGLKVSNLGQIYAELGDSRESFDFLCWSLEIFGRTDDPSGKVDALCALAELLLESAELERAEGYLDEALQLAEQTGTHEDRGRERLTRARHAHAEGKTERALKLALEALDHSTEGIDAGLRLEIHALLAELQALARQHEAASASLRALDSGWIPAMAYRRERVLRSALASARHLGDAAAWSRYRRLSKKLAVEGMRKLRGEQFRHTFARSPAVRLCRSLSLSGEKR